MIVQGIEVALWVAEKTGIVVHDRCQAIGYIRNKKLVAGVVFERFTGKDVLGHQRIDEPVPKSFWMACADYSYNKLGVKRITGLVDKSNEKAVKLNLHMGYRIEATLKEAGSDGGDLLIMAMWRDNCRILQWKRREANHEGHDDAESLQMAS